MYRPMALSLTRPAVVAPRAEAEPIAFEAIYSRHFRAVWRTLRRLGVAHAQLDDAAQDVFVVVHKKLATFDGRSVKNWLYAIAVRVASDQRRGAARRQTAPLPETLADEAPGPARASETTESVRLLHELLSNLDEKKRTVFVLSELEQLSVPEIAEVLGDNVNTVYSRLRAARAQFDAALTRHREHESGGQR
jgi:RNA polymerase sigma-70 factor (ECF subfamily)